MPPFLTDPPPAMLLVLWVSFALVLAYLFVKFVVSSRILTAFLISRSTKRPVTLLEVVGMRLRGVDPVAVMHACKLADAAELRLDLPQLETHYLARGDLPRVVAALALAKRHELELGWDEACAIDLAGHDVVKAVRAAAGLPAPDESDAVRDFRRRYGRR